MTLKINLVELDKVSQEEQEAFLATCPSATFYHSFRFVRFLTSLLDCKNIGFAARRGDKLVGTMPALARQGPYGTIINSLPFFGSHGSPVTDCQETHQALTSAWEECSRQARVASATVVSNPFDIMPLAFSRSEGAYFDQRISQTTALPTDTSKNMVEASLMDLVDATTRRNIRKAQKVGISVDVENDQWVFLEQSHRDGMAAIGGTSKDSQFFHLASKMFEPNLDYRLYVARQDGRPVAALLLFYHGDMVEYFVPTTVAEFRNAQPMAAILFKAMVDATNNGYRVWNWGGTWTTQDGVYKFKKKWGADERRYHYTTFVNNDAILDKTPDELTRLYPSFYVVPYGALHKRPVK